MCPANFSSLGNCFSWKVHLKGNVMNNALKFSALALAAVLATGCSSMSKETEARLTATEDADRGVWKDCFCHMVRSKNAEAIA